MKIGASMRDIYPTERGAQDITRRASDVMHVDAPHRICALAALGGLPAVFVCDQGSTWRYYGTSLVRWRC